MTPFETLREVRRRTAEAIIAQSGLSNNGLRQHLREMLSGESAADGALLQEPVIEGAHPFEPASQSLADLSGSLLHPDLVRELDQVDSGNEYRFPRTRRPFQHQYESWQRLLGGGSPQSVLVTSGTGSGKTECFLFPILHDLVSQASLQREPLEGVQAIMLYPLNALIESQRERLSVWTAPFKGKLRYCLYNGDLPKGDSKESERRRTPERVIDRPQLRASPPPVLVTNITMLEYMLARAEDQPTVDRSKGKLKWIVLDEAHSLVGAAAAEIALLLRRVLLSFEMKPEDVRFVATSATIGSGTEVREQLQRFLADVAGIPDERVHVIEGHRRMPGKPTAAAEHSVGDIRTADPTELYRILGSEPQVWRLVERLYRGSVPLADFTKPARHHGVDVPDLISAMGRAVRQTESGEGERLAPIRIHAFERAVPGIWSCINADCPDKAADWTFGRILAERADRCPTCLAPVLEIVSCTDCGEAYLEGTERGSSLSAPLRSAPRDEFAFDSAGDNDTAGSPADDADEGVEPDDVKAFEQDRLFAASPTASARGFWLDREDDWRVVDAPTETSVSLPCEEHKGPRCCPGCNPTGRLGADLLRSLRFGAPFLLVDAAPILLEGDEPATLPGDERLPSAGRRLLSFTDSRQGTARMAAKIQRESERNFVRSFVYHSVQASMRPAVGAEDQIARLRTDIEELEKVFAATRLPALEAVIADKRRELAGLSSPSADGIAWPELVALLSEQIEVDEWIKAVWEPRSPELFSESRNLAEFLLLREFARRPRKANSLETLGLARLRNPALERISEAQLPGAFKRRGKGLADWKSYLEMMLTHFLRANLATDISRDLLHWLIPNSFPKTLVGPAGEVGRDRGLVGWPSLSRGLPTARPKAFLVRGLDLDLTSPADRDDLVDCLEAAWTQVAPALSARIGRLGYSFRSSFVAPLVEAFYCKITRRIIDHAPFGISPYGIERDGELGRATPFRMPALPAVHARAEGPGGSRELIREWLEGEEVGEVRRLGGWLAFSDRVALFADYARSAEHSAQQNSRRLRRYEQDFKAGRINVLNCSTTMEMGVDIGSVSSVMMTNVPPSIANYRQRVGRAGRRNQAVALAFTFCRDRPLDREAFRNPQVFLERSMAAPKVTLSSRPIVQRHVNAYLLGCFMRENAGDAIKMQIGAFLGCPASPGEGRPLKQDRPLEAFLNWLDRPGTKEVHQDRLATLTMRSVLEDDRRVLEDARAAIEDLSKAFVAEWEALRVLAAEEGLTTSGKSRMAVELKRLCEEFLLSSLAERGFMPGHGFPTDVVSFIPGKEFKTEEEAALDGTRQYRAVGPQRSLDLAIRDYAPGSEVVLDGLVHKSAGVTLNWKRPASLENLAEIQSLRYLWRCTQCRTSGTSRGSKANMCSGCGSDALESIEFLSPAGFSVDPREKAHADTDRIAYVPPESPIVSARNFPWQKLPVPELGRFRSNREGLVYYSNRGPDKLGYALCLQCGRAEPDTDNRGVSVPPRALTDHKPLRYRKGQEICPGSDNPFSIRRNLSLGHEISTDVLELQPQHRLTRGGANALIIAMREALAQELGIDADEMGFAAEETVGELGARSVSLYLFDKAAGGAGFSISFEHLMRAVTRNAQAILDCKTPGCRKACAACVLTSDAPGGEDDLDRLAALEFVRNHLTFPDELGPDDRFVAGAELSLAPVDEIDRQLRKVSRSTLTIFCPDQTEIASMGEWAVARQFLSWAMRGHPVRLAIPQEMLEKLTAAEKLSVRDFSLRNSMEIIVAEAPVFANGSTALATVVGLEDLGAIWASREIGPRLPGPSWGSPASLVIARGMAEVRLQYSVLNTDTLLPQPGAKLIQIGAELDGDLATLGSRVADTMVNLLKECGAWSEAQISRVIYQDPYVCSPLCARMLIDTVAKLAFGSRSENTRLDIETRPPRIEDRRGEPWQIGHDWRDEAAQATVIELLAQQQRLRASVVHKAVPHGRFMTIDFTTGERATIVLDQGFGAWAPPRHVRLRYDFEADPGAQAKRLATVNVILQRSGFGSTYMVAAPAE